MWLADIGSLIFCALLQTCEKLFSGMAPYKDDVQKNDD